MLAAWIDSIDQLGTLSVTFNESLDTSILPLLDQIDGSMIGVYLVPSLFDRDINITDYEFSWKVVNIIDQ